MTYTDALPTYVHPQTHRVHTTYALAATTTRAAVVERTEPAEHSGPYRGRPKNPPRLYRFPRPQTWYRLTIRRSNCACWRRSPTYPC